MSGGAKRLPLYFLTNREPSPPLQSHLNQAMKREMAFRAIGTVLLLFSIACGRPTGVPDPPSGISQRLPFDRESRPNGISPSQSLIPATGHLAEGTSLTVHLTKPLSSASSHPGDNLEGVLDEPVMADGQIMIDRGAVVTGRVLDVRHAEGTRIPGYLRIALVSVDSGGKPVLIETSSIFVKGGAHEDHSQVANRASGSKDVVLTTDRRLTFRLAQAAVLQ